MGKHVPQPRNEAGLAPTKFDVSAYFGEVWWALTLNNTSLLRTYARAPY